ncbi:hypothetical protein [Pseudovibrio sp. Tun.PSC04-5.I4]|uniref:hypothetical protein n=1 Tax=Pseudovibrio sp. Tun.PSC04-5.I4 TaxID=1798213 RepID=UPI000884E8AB|nr:hypothetical protein [Pseudovibrio sp. Tun.PSC04-5.I4]SDR38992.1 hypothetical protein SAMN04515695_5253 [Pseudovibrio sp. Tun.PSC04-5.I4]
MFLSTLLTSAGLILATTITAQARPDTRTMTCQQTQTLVQKSGGIVLSTGVRTYDRFVSSLRFCQPPERLKSRWVPTKDQKKCFIGYSCEPPYDNDFDFFD